MEKNINVRKQDHKIKACWAVHWLIGRSLCWISEIRSKKSISIKCKAEQSRKKRIYKLQRPYWTKIIKVKIYVFSSVWYPFSVVLWPWVSSAKCTSTRPNFCWNSLRTKTKGNLYKNALRIRQAILETSQGTKNNRKINASKDVYCPEIIWEDKRFCAQQFNSSMWWCTIIIHSNGCKNFTDGKVILRELINWRVSIIGRGRRRIKHRINYIKTSNSSIQCLTFKGVDSWWADHPRNQIEWIWKHKRRFRRVISRIGQTHCHLWKEISFGRLEKTRKTIAFIITKGGKNVWRSQKKKNISWEKMEDGKLQAFVSNIKHWDEN